RPPRSPLFPYTTLFRSDAERQHQLDASGAAIKAEVDNADIALRSAIAQRDALAAQLLELKNGSRREEKAQAAARAAEQTASEKLDRKSTRLNSSHSQIS